MFLHWCLHIWVRYDYLDLSSLGRGFFLLWVFWRVWWLCATCLPGLLCWCVSRERLLVLEARILGLLGWRKAEGEGLWDDVREERETSVAFLLRSWEWDWGSGVELKEQNERCGSVVILLVALGGEAIVLVRVGGWGDTLSVGVRAWEDDLWDPQKMKIGVGETATCVLLQNWVWD